MTLIIIINLLIYKKRENIIYCIIYSLIVDFLLIKNIFYLIFKINNTNQYLYF